MTIASDVAIVKKAIEAFYDSDQHNMFTHTEALMAIERLEAVEEIPETDTESMIAMMVPGIMK